jgi:hypothetical protein
MRYKNCSAKQLYVRLACTAHDAQNIFNMRAKYMFAMLFIACYAFYSTARRVRPSTGCDRIGGPGHRVRLRCLLATPEFGICCREPRRRRQRGSMVIATLRVPVDYDFSTCAQTESSPSTGSMRANGDDNIESTSLHMRERRL